MDDLAGLDWNASNQQNAVKSTPLGGANYYPTLKSTPPLSGRSTPSSIPLQASHGKPPATPSSVNPTATTQNDSFANLLPFNSSQTPKNLSMKEQQSLLEEQKRKQATNQQRQWDGQFSGTISANTSAGPSRTASPAVGLGAHNHTLQGRSSSHNLSSGPVTLPGLRATSTSQLSRKPSEDVDDILAAFNSSAPVDKSSHFPAPSSSRSASHGSAPIPAPVSSIQNNELLGDDDDPFGLGPGPAVPTSSVGGDAASMGDTEEEDDVLGLLGKPISELPPKSPSPPVQPTPAHPVDKAIAELVDMGFAADKSRHALATTESGLDVQAAVGWLLNQAHAESSSKTQTSLDHGHGGRRGPADAEDISSDPAWMRQQSRTASRRRPEEHRSSRANENDATKHASDVSGNLFKTANSLWKSGQKRFNKAVADFNAEHDSSQPKWMKDPQVQQTSPVSRRRPSGTQSRNDSFGEPSSSQKDVSMTDEAMLLEMGGGRPQPTKSRKASAPPVAELPREPPAMPQRTRTAERSQPAAKPRLPDQPLASQSRSRITRQMIEDEQVQAYISPARRKKTTPKPQEPEPELLFDTAISTKPIAQSRISTPSQPQSSQPTRPTKVPQSAPAPTKAKAPSRNVPPLSSIALQSSTSHRVAGTAAFKLGNYAEANLSYTAALRDLPQNHPLVIVVLTNRALTNLKTGDPKQCIVDADTALQVIGLSKGVGETITIGGDEGTKDMAPYWGKAMMRRAEAHEQLEKWIEAAKIWKECVEAGVGGSTSIQGRTRCEKASGTGSASRPASRKPTPAPKRPTPKPTPKASALDDLSGRPVLNHAASSEAVTRLRAANEAAQKVDDERFALTDAVSERVDKWRKGKEQNLRALLGSLDTVLWADSGWKKVNMSELLNPNKVKINYMKGIAKVHPDKLPTTATTEQIMISGAVFSTLNEAWDGFKKENGL